MQSIFNFFHFFGANTHGDVAIVYTAAAAVVIPPLPPYQRNANVCGRSSKATKTKYAYRIQKERMPLQSDTHARTAIYEAHFIQKKKFQRYGKSSHPQF